MNKARYIYTYNGECGKAKVLYVILFKYFNLKYMSWHWGNNLIEIHVKHLRVMRQNNVQIAIEYRR